MRFPSYRARAAVGLRTPRTCLRSPQGRTPARCLAVDDAPDGIASALKAGMQVLAVRDGLLVPVPGLIPG